MRGDGPGTALPGIVLPRSVAPPRARRLPLARQPASTPSSSPPPMRPSPLAVACLVALGGCLACTEAGAQAAPPDTVLRLDGAARPSSAAASAALTPTGEPAPVEKSATIAAMEIVAFDLALSNWNRAFSGSTLAVDGAFM